jgi:ribosomal protein S12 methylthiotransferase
VQRKLSTLTETVVTGPAADPPKGVRLPGGGPMPRVSLVPLGCSKAQVDAEEMLGALQINGYAVVQDPRESDVVIVNTCGFIEPAKEESVEAILGAISLKESHGVRAVIVTGCLAERYPAELREDIPEADAIIPWTQERELVRQLDGIFGIRRNHETEWGSRTLISPRHWAYVRISEGCNHTCSFCSIPGIRGRNVSRKPDEIIEEIRGLIDLGVQEINLVAQDTSLYGIDIYRKPSLSMLLRRIADVDGLRWARLFYAHPAHIDDELIDVIAGHDNIVNYIDLPIQHINNTILKRMRRVVGRDRIESLIMKLRDRIPDAILRTSIIVGFPGETDEQFQELIDFLPHAQFDRLGCFTYSQEEGTSAEGMPDQVLDEVKDERQAVLMETQREISYDRNLARVGREYDILIESNDGETAEGRSYGEAPEVDGAIRLASGADLAQGSWHRARIVEAHDYDLTAEIVSR